MVSWLLNKVYVCIGFVVRFSGGRGVVYEAAGKRVCRRSAEETRRAVPEIQVHGSKPGAEETPVNAHSFKLRSQVMAVGNIPPFFPSYGSTLFPRVPKV